MTSGRRPGRRSAGDSSTRCWPVRRPGPAAHEEEQRTSDSMRGPADTALRTARPPKEWPPTPHQHRLGVHARGWSPPRGPPRRRSPRRCPADIGDRVGAGIVLAGCPDTGRARRTRWPGAGCRQWREDGQEVPRLLVKRVRMAGRCSQTWKPGMASMPRPFCGCSTAVAGMRRAGPGTRCATWNLNRATAAGHAGATQEGVTGSSNHAGPDTAPAGAGAAGRPGQRQRAGASTLGALCRRRRTGRARTAGVVRGRLAVLSCGSWTRAPYRSHADGCGVAVDLGALPRRPTPTPLDRR